VTLANKWHIDFNKRNNISYLQATIYYFIHFRNLPITRIFHGFPKVSDHFPKIISELSRTLAKIAEEDPGMFPLNINNLWLITIETWQTWQHIIVDIKHT